MFRAVTVSGIRDYISSWNENSKLFTWTATADEMLAKVRLVQTYGEETRQQLCEVTQMGSRDTSA